MKTVRTYDSFLIYRESGKLLLGIAYRFNPRLLKMPFARMYGFALRLQLGNGAGCKRGATAYFAVNPNSYLWCVQYRGGVLSNGKRPNLLARLTRVFFGITRNANIVPYMSR